MKICNIELARLESAAAHLNFALKVAREGDLTADGFEGYRDRMAIRGYLDDAAADLRIIEPWLSAQRPALHQAFTTLLGSPEPRSSEPGQTHMRLQAARIILAVLGHEQAIDDA